LFEKLFIQPFLKDFPKPHFKALSIFLDLLKIKIFELDSIMSTHCASIQKLLPHEFFETRFS